MDLRSNGFPDLLKRTWALLPNLFYSYGIRIQVRFTKGDSYMNSCRDEMSIESLISASTVVLRKDG